MSDVKEIGVIGQMYEDRTTGKVGTLESRDDKCKTLMMNDSEGKGFSISYSSFRSKWRKVKTEDTEADAVAETVATEQPEVENQPVVMEVEVSDEDAVKSFNDTQNGVNIVVDGSKYSFIKDSIEVMTVKRMSDNKYGVACLPDVYTLSDKLIETAEGFKCMPNKSGRDIMFALKAPLYKIIEYATEALVNLNTYGYIVTE